MRLSTALFKALGMSLGMVVLGVACSSQDSAPEGVLDGAGGMTAATAANLPIAEPRADGQSLSAARGNDTGDKDVDGILDAFDNCPLQANRQQLDADLDTVGDACDEDDDNDTLLDGQDNCPTVANASQSDQDGDGIGDKCDAGNTEIRSAGRFEALRVDSLPEDSAGPAVVVARDINQDGLMDLISAWDDSQPIQISLQGQSPTGKPTFDTFSVAGSGPFTKATDLEVADFDGDGNLDIVVAIETTGFTPDPFIADGDNSAALMILYAPDDPLDSLAWYPQHFDLSAHWECKLTEDEAGLITEATAFVRYRDGADTGFVGVEVGDVDSDGDPDVVAAFNGAVETPTATPKRVYLHLNPGLRGSHENNAGSVWYDTNSDGKPDACEVSSTTGWVERVIYSNVNDFVNMTLVDMDSDEDLDVVVSAPEQQTYRLAWLENFQDETSEFFSDVLSPEDGLWYVHSLGENLRGLGGFSMTDFDDDDRADLVIFSEGGSSVHWYRMPEDPKNQYFPWEVFDVAHTDLSPSAVSAGDLDGDGLPEVVVAAGNEIRMYSTEDADVYGTWMPTLVHVDDSSGTSIRGLIVEDLDGDGLEDIIGTLDRDNTRDDGLFWFHNLGD